MDEKDIINKFFSNNYSLLIKKCQDYALVYNYKLLQPDELVSELYLFTLSDHKRTSKLAELIQLTAETLNRLYAYNVKALYYISKILYNIVHGHRSFDNNANKNTKVIKIECHNDIETIGEDILVEEYVEFEEYDVDRIYEIANRHAHGENWWKYRLWTDHYKYKMTFKQLSEKYKLTQSPIFAAVKDFTKIIKKELQY
jgi:hypothetical protein